MPLILTPTQAQRIVEAAAYLNDIAIHETNIELFNAKNQKVRVCIFGNQVHVDLFACLPKDNMSERYATQSAFSSTYGAA